MGGVGRVLEWHRLRKGGRALEEEGAGGGFGGVRAGEGSRTTTLSRAMRSLEPRGSRLGASIQRKLAVRIASARVFLSSWSAKETREVRKSGSRSDGSTGRCVAREAAANMACRHASAGLPREVSTACSACVVSGCARRGRRDGSLASAASASASSVSSTLRRRVRWYLLGDSVSVQMMERSSGC